MTFGVDLDADGDRLGVVRLLRLLREAPEGSRTARALDGVRGALTTTDQLLCILIDAVNGVDFTLRQVYAAEGHEPEPPQRALDIITRDDCPVTEDESSPASGFLALAGLLSGG